MSERMTVNLRRNLDYVETEGMPRWTEDGVYVLEVLPSRDRFVGGEDVLVWAQRSNDRFAYVGLLRNVRVESDGLHFDRFDRLPRPVVLVDGADVRTDEFYDGTKGFMSDFSYIPEAAFHRAVAESMRAAKD